MSDPRTALVAAKDLRQAFDRAFAAAPDLDRQPLADYLAVGVGGDRYAVPLAGVKGVYHNRPISPLPGPLPELLGMVGLRGAICPVYDLRPLLGHSAGGASPAWLILADAAQPTGLACDAFEGLLRVPADAVAAPTDGPGVAQPHLRGLLRAATPPRPIIDLAAVLAWIRSRAQSPATRKER